MINRGFSRETLGNLHKRVIVAGKPLYSNAMSYDNVHAPEGISGAYQNTTPGHTIPVEKRMKRSSAIGEDLSISQISTLPGHHREVVEEARPVKIRSDYRSSINELPGVLKNPEKEPEPANPNVKFTRNTATTVEKHEQWGEPRLKKGPKQEIVPNCAPEVSDYGRVGAESNVSDI